MSAPSKTLADVLKAGADYLGGKGVENPRLICELLAARLLNCKRLELYLKFDAALSEKHLDAMRRGVTRAANHEPIQYILKQTGFYGRTFKTDPRALIPRPETETVVEKILEDDSIWSREQGAPLVIDVGTGTGCIVLTLALEKPDASYVAIDTSEDAIALARENAEALNVSASVTFHCSELPDCVEPESARAIVANLPYIPTAEYEKLPAIIREHEPRQALDGGENGIAVIETVIQDATFALQQGGRLFLEIGDDQAEAVTAVMASGGFKNIEVIQDLNSRDRMVRGNLE